MALSDMRVSVQKRKSI